VTLEYIELVQCLYHPISGVSCPKHFGQTENNKDNKLTRIVGYLHFLIFNINLCKAEVVRKLRQSKEG
jgi:hypothetical protein